MLEEEEYASSTDESDDDYKPEGHDSASEVDTDDDTETTEAERKNGNSTSRKRKEASPEPDAKKKKPNDEKPTTLSDDDDDSNEDALWATFMSKTESVATKPATSTSKPIQSTTKSIATTTTKTSTAKPVAQPIAKKPATVVDKPKTVTEIFEFAGEKIEVKKQIKTDDVISSKNAGTSTQAKAPAIPQHKPRGGLSAVLGQIGKPNKLSVLQKTHLDWDGFKHKEGIDEELQTHNKGRDGYLERQDFLQRTDVRQFEIEKSMRQTTRRK